MPTVIDLAQPVSDRTDPMLSFNTRGGGVSLAGTEQIISPLTAVWKWRVILPINSAVRARAIRTVKSKLKGRFNYLRVRVCDRYRIGRSDIGAAYEGSEVPFGDDAPFSDDSAFALAQPNSEIQVAAARGASSVRVLASYFAGVMTAGLFFSIHDYLYQVDDFALAGGSSEFIDLTFSPPLRVPAAVGDFANFDAKSIWVLDDDEAGRLDLRLGRFGQVELNLTEALGRSM